MTDPEIRTATEQMEVQAFRAICIAVEIGEAAGLSTVGDVRQMLMDYKRRIHRFIQDNLEDE